MSDLPATIVPIPPAFTEGAALWREPDRTALYFHGDDARTWLNGQTTNALDTIDAGNAVYTLFVNVKGRIMADAWVAAEGSDCVAIVPTSSLPLLRESFDKYIIMEDVDVEEREGRLVCIAGLKAREIFAQTAVAGTRGYPTDLYGFDGVVIWEDAIGENTGAWDALQSAGAQEVERATVDLARIARGAPAFGIDFDLHHYPQEAGLRDRAVSFSKGCYLGQEVVCMLENRGQVKRRLVQLQAVGTEKAPAPGTTITREGEDVGEVTSAAVDTSSNAVVALGYVKRKALDEEGPLQIGKITFATT